MNSFHVKKNDQVVVIAGTDKGKRGRVIAVDGKKQRAIVEGVRMTKKHMRKSQQYPHGQILQREGSIHISNLMQTAQYDARAAKRGVPAPAQA
jgi:large subunit ribosomal protein L24